MSKPAVLAEPVLVGREKELEELQSLLNSAIEGRGRTVFVSGEAGSGKTRLAKEFLRLVEEKNLNVFSGYCLSNTTIPYFPFLTAFDKYFSDIEGKTEDEANQGLEIRAWLTGLKRTEAGQMQNTPPEIWKDIVYGAVSKIFLSVAAKKPTVFFIDDVHWADSASLSLLNFFSRIIKSEKVLMLASFRSEELVTDEEGRAHPLSQLLHSMSREDLFREIKLTKLNQESISKIAESMVQGSIAPELSSKLSSESQGNALFVVETVKMLSERGNLVQKNYKWSVAIDSFGVPNKFKDIILRRLGILNFNQRRILDAASVIGEKFEPELLAEALNVSDLEILEGLNSIALSTSLVQPEGKLYRFGHAKFQETLYQEMAAPLKKGYHNRIAEKLESKKSFSVSDVAYHYTQADNKKKAIEYSLVAGEEAMNRFGYAEALKFLNYFLENTSDCLEYKEKRIQALTWLGDIYLWSGRFEDSYRLYVDLIEAVDSGAEKLKAIRHAIISARFTPHFMSSLELASKAEPYAQYDQLEYARIRWWKGVALSNLWKTPEGIEELEAALRIFESQDSPDDIIPVLIDLNVQYALNPDLARTRNHGIEWQEHYPLAVLMFAIAWSEEKGVNPWQTYWYAGLGAVFGWYCLSQQAIESHTKTIEIGEKIGSYGQMAWGHFFISWDRELMRDMKSALAHSLKGVELAEKTDQIEIQFYNFASLTRLYVLLEDNNEAEKWYGKMMDLFPQIEMSSDAMAVAHGWITQAVYLIGKGQWKESDEILEKKNLVGLPEWRDGYRAFSLYRQGRLAEANKIMEDLTNSLSVRNKKFDLTEIFTIVNAQKNIAVNTELPLNFYFVNTGKNRGSVLRIAGLVNSDLRVKLPSDCKMKNGCIEINERMVEPFKVEKMTLPLQPLRTGEYTLHPIVTYLDSTGQEKTFKPKAICFNVRPVLQAQIAGKTVSVTPLPRRVPTGFKELDFLLFGGIPEGYTVAVTSPSLEERQKLIEQYVAAGLKSGQTTFYLTSEPGATKVLAEEYPSSMCLFVCNPRADLIIKELPNVYKLKGVENLTDIDIALAKALRQLDSSKEGPRRACIEIVSDVLLQHHAVTTRKWLNGLIANLKAKGFTALAVIDPLICPEEVPAIIGLFDGEITLIEKEISGGREKFLRIQKLYNQKYSREELKLTNS